MKNLTLLSYLLIVTSLSNAQPVRIAAGGTIDKEYLDKISISQKNFIRQELEGRSRQNYFIDQKNRRSIWVSQGMTMGNIVLEY
jgi:hypothetical protein